MGDAENNSLEPINQREQLERIQANPLSVEELAAGSTVMSLEAAFAIQMEKIDPVGYDQVADFFRSQYGRTTDAHCARFMVEAEKAGKMDELRQKFPQVEQRAKSKEQRAKRIVDYMKENNPRDIEAIIQRVQQQNYSFDQIRQQTAHVAKFVKELFETWNTDRK